jgi:hypothetical protein
MFRQLRGFGLRLSLRSSGGRLPRDELFAGAASSLPPILNNAMLCCSLFAWPDSASDVADISSDAAAFC